MFPNMKIKTKLLTSFLLVSITPFLIYGVVSLYYSADALSEQAFAKLEAVRDLKKAQLRKFFNERQGDMLILRQTAATLRQAAFQKLKTVQEIKKAQIETYFRQCKKDAVVLSENATVGVALETCESLVDANGAMDMARYDIYEKIRYGDAFKRFKSHFGFDDMVLVTRQGVLVYGLNREEPLGENLLTGSLKDTLLFSSFQRGLKKVTISDFAPYPSSGGRRMQLISAPIYIQEEIEGVLILKIDAQAINRIVHRRQGMGATGETYLVGRRNGKIRLRSDLQIEEGKLGDHRAGEGLEKALNGYSGSLVQLDNAENMKIVRYDPLETPDLNWAMITEMNLEEVIAPKLTGEKEDYFTKFVNCYDYEDLLLIHPQGAVFYSVAHGPEYGTNLATGAYTDSVLGRLLKRAVQARQFVFSDIQAYPDQNGTPALFMAQPVIFADQIELIVALRVSVDAINAVMRERSGMGDTGETYLVGEDGRMRSDSFRDPEHYSVAASFANPEQGSIDTIAIREALSGDTGRQLITTYHGSRVLSAYTPLDMGGVTWALIAETDVNEALAGVRNLKILTGLACFVAIVLISCVALILTRRVIQPVNSVVERIKAIAEGKGDLTTRLVVHRNDEMGDLAKWFNIFVENVRAVIKEIAQNAHLLSSNAPVFLKLSNQMASDAERMSQISNSLSGTSEEMSANVNTIAAAAEQMSFNISSISSTSEQMSGSMNTMAGAMEEMSVSISGVAASSRQSGEIANQAAEMANNATQLVNGLGEAAQSIGDVTRIIAEIAEQTNMLALNATIQAASAGKAGKGFAVIAKEIKDLAIQSAESSADIAARIEAVQAETQNAIEMIENVTETIQSIHQATHVVDDAVKQQASAVDEISANARQTSRGASDIAAAIAEVSQSASDMSANAGDAAKAAAGMSSNVTTIKQAADEARSGSEQVDRLGKGMVDVTNQLQQIVNKFKIE